MKPLRWRIIFVTLISLLSLYCVTPTIIYFMQPLETRNDEDAFKAKLPSWLPQSHVKLGLDIQGGVQLVLGVKTDEAITNKLNRIAVETTRWASDSSVAGVETAYVVKGTERLTVKLTGEEHINDFSEKFGKQFPLLSKIKRDGATLTYAFKDNELERIKTSALEQAERVVRSRVDQWGVSEPMINRRFDGTIMVQLPGFRNPQKARELLGRTAQLEFKIVDDEFKGFETLKNAPLPEGVTLASHGQTAFTSESKEKLTEFLKAHVPEDHQLLFSREQIGDGSQVRYRWTSYVVRAATELIGDDVLDAQFAQQGGLDQSPKVYLKMTAMGGKRFGDVTGANVGKRLAIVLDNVIESAPVINQKITGGNAEITLGASGRNYDQVLEEGNQLALILKSGAIPASITVLEEKQVGASLGPELANQGIKGSLIGFLLIIVFMIFYYQRPGAVACFALLLNAMFHLAIMAGFGFALSLPGIAGFILTLGIGVDANVLINERIRQEIREGKHPRTAVHTAFKRVFWTIMDTNVTNIIAAMVLLETNPSGPIRGFAVTLLIGLAVSLFTALYCSVLFFDIALVKVADKNLKSWLGGDKPVRTVGTYFNFLKIGQPLTILFIVIGLGIFGTTMIRGLNLGVDFAGGAEVMIGFDEPVQPEVLRNLGEDSKLDGFSLQALGADMKQYLIRYDEHDDHKDDNAMGNVTASDTFQGFKTTLLEKLKDSKPEILSVGFVGPQIGKEMRNRGIISVLYAILAIMLYIAFRFDMRFTPGAVVKMFLDSFLVLGFYVIFWASFDLVSVAAFMTIVGYSVNDVIVIYDRIRENLMNHPRRSLLENINYALNETLARSINTSLAVIASMLGILIFGTGQIWTFAVVMSLGVIFATISSTFVATSFVLWFEQWKKNKFAIGKAKTA